MQPILRWVSLLMPPRRGRVLPPVRETFRDVHVIRDSTETAARVLTTAQGIVNLLIVRRYDLIYTYDPVEGHPVGAP
jgi:hypothetical protein